MQICRVLLNTYFERRQGEVVLKLFRKGEKGNGARPAHYSIEIESGSWSPSSSWGVDEERHGPIVVPTWPFISVYLTYIA